MVVVQEKVGIVGLGYVGLPLALAFAERGVDVLSVDCDPRKTGASARGQGYLRNVPSSRIAAATAAGRWTRIALERLGKA